MAWTTGVARLGMSIVSRPATAVDRRVGRPRQRAPVGRDVPARRPRTTAAAVSGAQATATAMTPPLGDQIENTSMTSAIEEDSATAPAPAMIARAARVDAREQHREADARDDQQEQQCQRARRRRPYAAQGEGGAGQTGDSERAEQADDRASAPQGEESFEDHGGEDDDQEHRPAVQWLKPPLLARARIRSRTTSRVTSRTSSTGTVNSPIGVHVVCRKRNVRRRATAVAAARSAAPAGRTRPRRR